MHTSKQAGFTLIELMATLVILALILAIATPAMGQLGEQARQKTREISIESLERAGEFAYLNKHPLDENVPEGLTQKQVYTILELEQAGFVKLAENSEFRSDEQYVKRMPTGEFVYMGVGVPEEPETPEISVPDDDYCPSDAGMFAVEPVDGGVQINGFRTGYSHPSTEIDFPNTICGTLVAALGPYAFQQEGLTRVDLPDGLTEVAPYAFQANELTEITVPDHVLVIRDYAFASNKLEQAMLPHGLDEIGSNAFLGNHLTEIDIPSSVGYLGTAAFSLNQITEVVLPQGIQEIEANLFHENHLTHITIPEGVEWIGPSAFIKNNLTSVVIPESVTFIDSRAFSQNQLTDVTLPAGLTVIKEQAFYANDLTSLVIPKGVQTIEFEAFKLNDLTVVELPSSVSIVAKGAFTENLLRDVLVRNRYAHFDNNGIDKYTFGHFFTNREVGAITPRANGKLDNGTDTEFARIVRAAGLTLRSL